MVFSSGAVHFDGGISGTSLVLSAISSTVSVSCSCSTTPTSVSSAIISSLVRQEGTEEIRSLSSESLRKGESVCYSIQYKWRTDSRTDSTHEHFYSHSLAISNADRSIPSARTSMRPLASHMMTYLTYTYTTADIGKKQPNIVARASDLVRMRSHAYRMLCDKNGVQQLRQLC